MSTLTDKFLTIREFSELCKCHPETTRRWIRNGTLRSFKVGNKYLIPKDWALRWIFAKRKNYDVE